MNWLKRLFILCKNKKYGAILYKLCDLLRLDKVIFRLPALLMIEPVNACNARCPTCPTGSGRMNRPLRMMSFQEFKMIIDQVNSHVGSILLWNYGEPFLNKELVRMIQYAVSHGMYVMTSTNGQFFGSREFLRELVESGLHDIIVSCDGLDQPTLSKFRTGCRFDAIADGLRSLYSVKKELNSVFPKVTFQFIVMKHNEHQKEDMKRLAKDLHVDIYYEKTVDIDGEDPEFQDMAKELLPNDLAFSRYSQGKGGIFSLKGDLLNYCSWIYRTMVINSDGTVVPCSYDRYSRYVMGNAFTEDIEMIWNNEKYRSFRKNIAAGRKSLPVCHACPEGRGYLGAFLWR
jgi:radical SAM protein with 4Fe4S-binding SPASM domain